MFDIINTESFSAGRKNSLFIGKKMKQKLKNSKKFFNYGVLFLSTIVSFATFAMDSKEAADFVKANDKKLGLKKGEEIKKWDIFKSEAFKGNTMALESILEARKLFMEGYYLSIYKYDLYEVFSKNPTFFLLTSKKYFGDEGQCAAFWLLPSTGENEIGDINKVVKSNRTKELESFATLATKFSKLSQDEKRNKSEKCFMAK